MQKEPTMYFSNKWENDQAAPSGGFGIDIDQLKMWAGVAWFHISTGLQSTTV